MIALALSILCAVAFGHIMKWATHARANLLWVAAINYFGASVTCAVVTVALVRPGDHAAFTVITGLWAGVTYLLSLLLYFEAVHRIGMGLATSVNRLAVGVPVAFAILIWHEPLGRAQAIGLALVALALPMLGSGKVGVSSHDLFSLVGVLLPLFVITGAGQVANRIFSSGAPSENAYLFLACLFGAAAFSAIVALAIQPVRLRRMDVGIGLLLGAANMATNVLLLVALRQLPSAEVFSVSSAASVVLAAITGVLFWREAISRIAVMGIVIAAFAVVLLAG